MTQTKKVVFSPFARVEGDIRVEVEVSDCTVTSARASGTSFRGFEPMLRGRDMRDGMVITPRVCGQCNLAHSAVAAMALGALARVVEPPNGQLARAVMLGSETVLNHLTHFYLSFAPDLVRPGEGDEGTGRFRPASGASFRAAVEARREFLPALGIFAGKWPNSLALQPGGSTRPVDRSEIARTFGTLLSFRDFVENRLIGGPIDDWLGLRSQADLLAWMGQARQGASDLAVFWRTAMERNLDRIGQGPGTFVSCGGWKIGDGRTWLNAGFFDGTRSPLALERVTEHQRFSWFEPPRGSLHPSQGRTVPAPERAEAYSWVKAPRYDGRPAETGPLARMLCDGDPLTADLYSRRGGGVLLREFARLHELVRLVQQFGSWLDTIRTQAPFLTPVTLPDAGDGVGVVEAPRGMLGHWLSVRQGKIHGYQIVTPTAWNFSPRDGDGTPGPVESALVGARHGDPEHPGEVDLVVKSFDPCLFCAVH